MSNPFSAVIETDRLKTFIETQRALVHEAKWHLNGDGIHARAVDPANVAMFLADLERGGFEHYHNDTDDQLIGLNLDQLHDYVTAKAAGELIELALDLETRKLEVDVGTTAFTMALIDPDSIRKEPDPSDLDLPSTIGVDGATFANAVDATGQVSDHIDMIVDPDERAFIIRGQGDTDDATTTLSDEELLSADTGTDRTESVFSLEYLEEIVGAIPSDAAVKLQLGHEYPLVMEWANTDDSITVTNNLAPRIQSD